jgi:hypothetical protein
MTALTAMVRNHSVSTLVVHVVWATAGRVSVLPLSADDWLARELSRKCTALGAVMLAVGNAADHVHIVVQPAFAADGARCAGRRTQGGVQSCRSCLGRHGLRLRLAGRVLGGVGRLGTDRTSFGLRRVSAGSPRDRYGARALAALLPGARLGELGAPLGLHKRLSAVGLPHPSSPPGGLRMTLYSVPRHSEAVSKLSVHPGLKRPSRNPVPPGWKPGARQGQSTRSPPRGGLLSKQPVCPMETKWQTRSYRWA